MPLIRATDDDIKLLARLMRAEAEGEGEQGMILVGTVGVNRVRSDCLDFRDVRTISDMVFQRPGGFVAATKPYFYHSARTQEINLARRVVQGYWVPPGRRSLWFFRPPQECPPSWYGQSFSGQYRNHCFYNPGEEDCPRLYGYPPPPPYYYY